MWTPASSSCPVSIRCDPAGFDSEGFNPETFFAGETGNEGEAASVAKIRGCGGCPLAVEA